MNEFAFFFVLFDEFYIVDELEVISIMPLHKQFNQLTKVTESNAFQFWCRILFQLLANDCFENLILELRAQLVRNESRFHVLFQANCVGLGSMWILISFFAARLHAEEKQSILKHSMVVPECDKVNCHIPADLSHVC